MDEGLQPAAGLGLAVGAWLFAQEAVNVRATDFNRRRAHDLAVKFRQHAVVLEDDVCAPLGLIHAPVQTGPKAPMHRHPARRHLIQHPMQPLGLEVLEQRLRRRKVADVGEAVVGLLETKARRAHLPLQPVMAVATELEAKRGPRRNAQMAQAKFRVEEVNVEVLALARTPLELEKAGLLIFAHLETPAPFHRTQDADHALATSAYREDFLDEGLLALPGMDLPDFDALGPGQRPDMVSHLQPELVGVALVELHEGRATPAQMLLHRSRPADGLVSAKKHHPVKALDHTLDVLRISIHQRLRLHPFFLPHTPPCFINLLVPAPSG